MTATRLAGARILVALLANVGHPDLHALCAILSILAQPRITPCIVLLIDRAGTGLLVYSLGKSAVALSGHRRPGGAQ